VRKGLNMTAADAITHQERVLGRKLEPYERAMLLGLKTADTLPTKTIQRVGNELLRLESGMNKTEWEFSRILAAQKARGEIVEWRYQGVRLPWGADPKTGRAMHYKPDFYVVSYALHGPKDAEKKYWIIGIKIIEVKGGHIWDRDKVRFRGARAEWPMFEFELWQKKAGQWKRLE